MNRKKPKDDTSFKILSAIAKSPPHSQRNLSRTIGMSLGSVNFCLNALIKKGLVKVGNFKNNENKLAYAYLLTPKGVKEKSKLTAKFLRRKMQEYELLSEEIFALEAELKETAKAEKTIRREKGEKTEKGKNDKPSLRL
ncbi:MAG: MarR family EPS-associated transcriptional regulator [Alphaproteobacteria bacterium]|nr:MarR family EPS-associated transcriptional regulator [Alphaproteobacteria bacterium]